MPARRVRSFWRAAYGLLADGWKPIRIDDTYRVTETVGSSADGRRPGRPNAIARANTTLRNIDWFEVTQMRGHIAGGDGRGSVASVIGKIDRALAAGRGAGLGGDVVDPSWPGAAAAVGVRGVPVPGRGDRGRGQVIPALWLSFRDVEELLAERGVEVDHVSVFRWVHRFTPLLVDAARFARHTPGDQWFRRRDLRQGRRDLAVRVPGHRPARTGHRRTCLTPTRILRRPRRFFTRALATSEVIPTEVVAGAARSTRRCSTR